MLNLCRISLPTATDRGVKVPYVAPVANIQVKTGRSSFSTSVPAVVQVFGPFGPADTFTVSPLELECTFGSGVSNTTGSQSVGEVLDEIKADLEVTAPGNLQMTIKGYEIEILAIGTWCSGSVSVT